VPIYRAGDKELVYEKDGKTYIIPPHVHLQVALFQMQNSEEYWKRPQIFAPERFLSEENVSESSPNKDLVGNGIGNKAWLAFGNGPRDCIGKRYAMMVMKLVMCKIILHYDLRKCEKTEDKIELLFKTATMTPKNGSYVQLLWK